MPNEALKDYTKIITRRKRMRKTEVRRERESERGEVEAGAEGKNVVA